MIPSRHRAAYTAEKTYKKLLGPLGMVSSIWSECVFVDAVSDLAVVGRPEGQAFKGNVETAWDEFIEDIERTTQHTVGCYPLRISGCRVRYK